MRVMDRVTAMLGQFMTLPAPARVFAGGAIGSITVVVVFVVLSLASWWLSSARQIDTLEPRVAQILGFIESEQQVDLALSQREALLLKMVYPDSGASGRGGAVLQERVRNLSAESGLTVIGSEVLEPELLEDTVKLTLSTKVAGPPEALIEFFRQLSEARPFLFVTSFSVNNQSQYRRAARGDAQSAEANLLVDIRVHAYQMAPQG